MRGYPYLKLGSDPEVFVTDGSTTESGVPQIIPAAYVLGGDNDLKLPFGKAYPDGAAIEFTVDPATDCDSISHRIFANLETIREFVAEKGYKLSLSSWGYVGQDWITQYPPEWGTRASLQILGCSADFNIYRDNLPPRPDPKKFDYRSIGGHMHVELPDHEEYKTVRFSKLLGAALDATVGIVTARACSSPRDMMRKSLYGVAGTYRRPSYGLEYRTPPARALLTNIEFTRQIFYMAHQVRTWLLDTPYLRPGKATAREYRTLITDFFGGADAVRETAESIDSGRPQTTNRFSSYLFGSSFMQGMADRYVRAFQES